MNALIVAANNHEDYEWTTPLKERWNVHVNIVYQPKGREADSYLSWICSTWAYPDEIVFVQGDPFKHDLDFLKHLEDPSVRYYGEVVECNADGAPHYEAPLHAFCEDFELPKPTTFRFVAGAQYRISKQQLQTRPISIYHHMLEVCQKESKAPWVMERLWPLIWGIEL